VTLELIGIVNTGGFHGYVRKVGAYINKNRESYNLIPNSGTESANVQSNSIS